MNQNLAMGWSYNIFKQLYEKIMCFMTISWTLPPTFEQAHRSKILPFNIVVCRYWFWYYCIMFCKFTFHCNMAKSFYALGFDSLGRHYMESTTIDWIVNYEFWKYLLFQVFDFNRISTLEFDLWIFNSRIWFLEFQL